MERVGTSDMDGCAARVAARESGDERVNLSLFFLPVLANSKRCLPPSFNYGAAGDSARHDKSANARPTFRLRKSLDTIGVERRVRACF
jgi:hypothetical protein